MPTSGPYPPAPTFPRGLAQGVHRLNSFIYQSLTFPKTTPCAKLFHRVGIWHTRPSLRSQRQETSLAWPPAIWLMSQIRTRCALLVAGSSATKCNRSATAPFGQRYRNTFEYNEFPRNPFTRLHRLHRLHHTHAGRAVLIFPPRRSARALNESLRNLSLPDCLDQDLSLSTKKLVHRSNPWLARYQFDPLFCRSEGQGTRARPVAQADSTRA